MEVPESLAKYSEQELLVLKAKLLCDFEFYNRAITKWVEGYSFIVKPFHKEQFATINKIVSGDPSYKYVIVNLPPRCGKTDVWVKNLFSWVMINNPKARNIHTSYSTPLALDNSAAILKRLKCEEIVYLFGEIVSKDERAREKWKTKSGGGMRAASSDSGITGFGAGLALERDLIGTGSPADGFGGLILVDDPLKPGEAGSDTQRSSVNSNFSGTLVSRRNNPNVPMVIIMQRVHEEDLSGYLLGGGFGDPEDWMHIKFPAVVGEESNVLTTDEGWDTIFPEKYSKEFMRTLKKYDPYTYAGQYQQEPAPLDGGIFKREWFGWYEELPKLQSLAIYADTAMKAKENNDYSVFQLWGISKDRQSIYLVDQLRGKWEAPDLLKEAVEFWTRCNARGLGRVTAFNIEDKSSGTGLIQQLRRERVPVKEISRSDGKMTGDKEVRARSASPMIAQGRVFLPKNAPWIGDYVHEFISFPNAKHDDQVDPTCDAVLDNLVEYSPLSRWVNGVY
jgi:predicted phage terminase large subunit-like protein